MIGPIILRIAGAVCGLALFAPGASAQSGVAEVNGVSLPYEIEGSGTPLVLVHGAVVHGDYWDDDVARLARRHTVIRYDRRGFGEASGKPDLTADPADLAALLDRLGYDRAHVMGHSQGTAVALTFALRHPERVGGLVLFGPVPPDGLVLPAGEEAAPLADWIAIGKAQGVDSLRASIARWAAEQFGDDSLVVQRGAVLLESYDGADLLDPAPPSNLVEPARVDELHAVAAPTLVVVGEREMAQLRIAADVLAYGIPAARKVVIPGGGHLVNWSEPERFAAEVLRFLREVDRASGR